VGSARSAQLIDEGFGCEVVCELPTRATQAVRRSWGRTVTAMLESVACSQRLDGRGIDAVFHARCEQVPVMMDCPTMK